MASRFSEQGSRPLPRAMFIAARLTLVLALLANLAAVRSNDALKLARMLNLLFRRMIRQRRAAICVPYFEALFRTMRYDRIAREVPGEEVIANYRLNHMAGVAHLYASNPTLAKYFLRRAISIHAHNHLDHRMLGRAFLLEGNRHAATRAFRRSVEIYPASVMAHQNYAGRYDIAAYRPKAWELGQAGELLVYDNLGQLAEDFFLQGRSQESFRLYGQMLQHQEQRARYNEIPPELRSALAARYASFDAELPIRLLPYEWVTQFGHIGLLDSYCKMARLGMYPAANYVVLAPESKVINTDYLSYWDDHFVVVRDADLVDELFPYQRYVGDGFMAYRGGRDAVEPWTKAAARAQVRWGQQALPPLLRLSPQDRAHGLEKLAELGVPDGAWCVGLHVREGGYYAESELGMSAHRNARIEDYLAAITEITARGGWVVRLGDTSMRHLPPMPQVVDYARSAAKSAQMDLFLLASSRFVVGTTTGLTTACLSFGTPMLLVNCISNDWQLWTQGADFIVKRVYDRRNRRFLTLAETYRPPVQGLLINSAIMNRHGYVAIANGAEEIAEAVRYKLDLLDGIRLQPDDVHPTIAGYRRALAGNPHMFGAARPVVPFLERHPELLDVVPMS